MAINNVQLQDFINKEYQNISQQERALTGLIEGHIKVIVQPHTNLIKAQALRIAKILAQSVAVPPNILCLTSSVSTSAALQN